MHAEAELEAAAAAAATTASLDDCCYSACDLKAAAAAAAASLASESRLSRVKRMLTAGWRGAARASTRTAPPPPPPAHAHAHGAGRGRTFGLPLRELPLEPALGVPRVLVRLCVFIESHGPRCGGVFRLSGGSPALVERLRAAFDAQGDCDLQAAAADAPSAAQLLRLWLRDLPDPLLPPAAARRILALHADLLASSSSSGAGAGPGAGRWREEAARVVRALAEPHARCLRYLLLFLRRVEQRATAARCPHCPPHAGAAAALGPLLLLPPPPPPAADGKEGEGGVPPPPPPPPLPPAAPHAAQLALARLVHDAQHICAPERLLDDCVPGSFADAPPPAAASAPSPPGASAELNGGGGGGGGPGGGGGALNGGPAPAPAPASASAPATATSAPAAQRHRKRKERHESCGSAQERKVVRSNSEERPLENGVSRSKESIRRVSSHEDFSSVRSNNKHHHKSKHHHHHHHSNKIEDSEGVCMTLGDGDSSSTTSGNTSSSSATTTTTTTTTASANNNLNNSNNHNKSFLSEVIDTNMGHGVRMSGMPLHERNESQSLSEHHIQHGSVEREEDDLTEESEHERRRSSERFARAAGMSRGRRNIGRRRRPTHSKSSGPSSSSPAEDTDGGSSSKENEDQDCNLSRTAHQMQAALSSDEEGNSSRSSSSHSFLQLHPQEQERVPSPEPSPGIVGGPPPLDLTTLHQQVGGAEPLTSRATWSREGGEHEEMIASSRVMLSPRNSLILSRRVYLDTNVPPSPPHERDGVAVQVAQARLKQLGKQMSSMKKKLKRLEEEFEKEYGYRPSHAEKATNKEMKKLCSELSKIRKEMKQLKEDPHNADIQSQGEENVKSWVASANKSAALTMEEALHEVEQVLADKRKHSGRPEALEDLSREQLLEEKVAVQKGLLHLEDMYGRPVTKGDRDLVRPLYDRYRMLKRMVIRTAPSKMKDSISELATIHEHETMDFTSSPPSLAAADDEDSQDTNITAAAAAAAAVVTAGPPPSMCLSESSEALWKNLHSLSLSELLSQQRSTREEKKRLRRSLREFEEDFQHRTGKKLQREDRLPMEGVYSSYKQAKAKLRLLDALVSKVSS